MSDFLTNKRWLVELGAVTWVSFLGAGVATMLFFATFDPQDLVSIATFPLQLSRVAVYSIGFVLFWVLLIANGLMAIWLSAHAPSTNKVKQNKRPSQE